MEGYGPATYGEAFADVYDDWYGGLAGLDDAVATIADLAGDGPVLELGVGSGRLAVPLAATGTDVWGLDASPAMLERLAARPGGELVRAALGDMADPRPALTAAGAPGEGFTVVVLAFNTFFLLASDGAQASCLEASAALLAPGGCLVVEAFVPADPPADAETVLEPRAVELDRVVFTVSTHRPAEQLVQGQHVELRDGGGVRLRPWVLRYRTPDQLDEAAGAAGLRRRERWAGWDRRPATDADPLHVSVYVRG